MAMKKMFLMGVFYLLLPCPASAQEVDSNALLRVIEDNQIRIQRLERTVDDLRARIRELESQLAAGGTGDAQVPTDPLLGSWQCTNNVFNNTISFARNGQVVQQEATFGNARNTTWSRLNESEIVVAGNVVLRTDFYSEDSLSVTVVRSKAVWECERR